MPFLLGLVFDAIAEAGPAAGLLLLKTLRPLLKSGKLVAGSKPVASAVRRAVLSSGARSTEARAITEKILSRSAQTATSRLGGAAHSTAVAGAQKGLSSLPRAAFTGTVAAGGLFGLNSLRSSAPSENAAATVTGLRGADRFAQNNAISNANATASAINRLSNTSDALSSTTAPTAFEKFRAQPELAAILQGQEASLQSIAQPQPPPSLAELLAFFRASQSL